jgi:hypothetical protein
VGGCGLDSSGLGRRREESSFEHCDEPLGAIKVGEFSYLSDYQLFRRYCAPCSYLFLYFI